MSKTITSWHTLAALRIPEPTRSGLGDLLLWILVYHSWNMLKPRAPSRTQVVEDKRLCVQLVDKQSPPRILSEFSSTTAILIAWNFVLKVRHHSRSRVAFCSNRILTESSMNSVGLHEIIGVSWRNISKQKWNSTCMFPINPTSFGCHRKARLRGWIEPKIQSKIAWRHMVREWPKRGVTRGHEVPRARRSDVFLMFYRCSHLDQLEMYWWIEPFL